MTDIMLRSTPDTAKTRALKASHLANHGHKANPIDAKFPGTEWQTLLLCCNDTVTGAHEAYLTELYKTKGAAT